MIHRWINKLKRLFETPSPYLYSYERLEDIINNKDWDRLKQLVNAIQEKDMTPDRYRTSLKNHEEFLKRLYLKD